MNAAKLTSIAVLAAALVFAGVLTRASAQVNRAKPAVTEKKEDNAGPENPPPKWVPPPYEARLLRLSELMGALAFLQDLCASTERSEWRKSMLELLKSEGKNPQQKARLAGAFNAGFRGYELNYRSCTPHARLIISRFLLEGEKIARDLADRYGSG